MKLSLMLLSLLASAAADTPSTSSRRLTALERRLKGKPLMTVLSTDIKGGFIRQRKGPSLLARSKSAPTTAAVQQGEQHDTQAGTTASTGHLVSVQKHDTQGGTTAATMVNDTSTPKTLLQEMQEVQHEVENIVVATTTTVLSHFGEADAVENHLGVSTTEIVGTVEPPLVLPLRFADGTIADASALRHFGTGTSTTEEPTAHPIVTEAAPLSGQLTQLVVGNDLGMEEDGKFENIDAARLTDLRLRQLICLIQTISSVQKVQTFVMLVIFLMAVGTGICQLRNQAWTPFGLSTRDDDPLGFSFQNRRLEDQAKMIAAREEVHRGFYANVSTPKHALDHGFYASWLLYKCELRPWQNDHEICMVA